jgi:hypothetical protein
MNSMRLRVLHSVLAQLSWACEFGCENVNPSKKGFLGLGRKRRFDRVAQTLT